MASESDQTLTDISSEDLCQHWFDSYEEARADETCAIYRPEHFRASWVSWFRMQYIFYKNGDCEWFCADPGDRHHFKPGKWRVDANDRKILHIDKGGSTESYRVVELTKEILRIARINLSL